MAVYMIIEAEISDPVDFKQYAISASRLVEQFGGEYIVRGAQAEVLEGDWSPSAKLVISKWPTRNHAMTFWQSSEYEAIKPLRTGAAKVRIALLEGVDEN